MIQQFLTWSSINRFRLPLRIRKVLYFIIVTLPQQAPSFILILQLLAIYKSRNDVFDCVWSISHVAANGSSDFMEKYPGRIENTETADSGDVLGEDVFGICAGM